jgi:hypothetical protein
MFTLRRTAHVPSANAAIDAKSAYWLREAVYVEPESGKQIIERDSNEKRFVAEFAEGKGAQQWPWNPSGSTRRMSLSSKLMRGVRPTVGYTHVGSAGTYQTGRTVAAVPAACMPAAARLGKRATAGPRRVRPVASSRLRGGPRE